MANTKYLNQVKLNTTFTPSNSAIVASDTGQVVAEKTQGQINAITPPTLPLSLANGGTNANLTASNGGIFYSGASAGAILAGTATANQVLLSGASTTPAWSTATYPATTTINRILYSSNNSVIGQITTANSAVLVTDAGGVPSLSTTLPAVEAGSCTCTDPTTASSASINTALSNVYNVTASTLINVQVFTTGTAATYTKTAGTKNILVEVVGGGGGGGFATGTAGGFASAGGGAGGGYARLFVANASNTYTYTVGGGGAGGAVGSTTGATGGTTTFSASSLQATGGTGGQGSSGITSVSASGFTGCGTGGTGSNGNVNANGGPGGWGLAVLGNVGSGFGGNSYFGGGAPSISNNTLNGVNATNYGGGGSGACATTVNKTGGNGAAGIIVVWEFS